MKLFLRNYLATMFFIFLTYIWYTSWQYYRDFFNKIFDLPFIEAPVHALSIFVSIILVYTILLIPFYMILQEKGKALLVCEGLWKKCKNPSYSFESKEKVALLAWCVKIFWAPLMIFWFTGHMIGLIESVGNSYNNIGLLSSAFRLFFDNHLFWLCFNLILTIDVFFFTVGYLIEMPWLKNTIRSVEPTFFGWFVALACYPPFNSHVTDLVGWMSRDFPTFTSTGAHILFNICILILMGIYSWASFALGLKSSNLTNRGIISKGPYKYIRHPAYMCKNTAWWIGGLPFIIEGFNTGNYRMVGLTLLALIGWTTLYYFRAITEENHLSQDKDYEVYKKKVPYKFIYGLY